MSEEKNVKNSQTERNANTEQASKEREDVKVIGHIILFLILGIVCMLGYPLFELTTKIYRAELPTHEVETNYKEFNERIHYQVPVFLKAPSAWKEYIPRIQSALDSKMVEKYPHLKDIWSLELYLNEGNATLKDNYILEVEYLPHPDSEYENYPLESFFVSPYSKATKIRITDHAAISQKLEEFIAHVLIDGIFGEELDQLSRLVQDIYSDEITMPYSSKYNVVFSLMVESGKKLLWNFKDTIDLFSPIFNQLSPFANFSVSTQTQYYSNLKFTPYFRPDYNKEVWKDGAYIISEAELSTFVNYGDWNLFSHDIHPTINFIIYVPDSYDGIPLIIENSQTNSFLIPRWGGVYIYNKQPNVEELTEQELLPVMEIFSSHLAQLLGLPKNPVSPMIKMDILFRTSTYRNLKQAMENLDALVKLTNSLKEISVPKKTKDYVTESLKYFELSLIELQKGDFGHAVEYSSRSFESSNKAFFEKEMVQQAYFPSEHRLAVFLPLLGPVFSIMLLGLLKYIQENKKVSKEKAD